MIFSDAFLKKLYIFLAFVWMGVAILTSVAAGLASKNFRDGAELFLYMMYPYYAVAIVYWMIKVRLDIGAGDEKNNNLISVGRDRIVLLAILVLTAIPYILFVKLIMNVKI